MHESQVALITGAGSGIGLALARILSADGYRIAGIDVREAGLRALADASPGRPLASRLADVTDPAGLSQAVRELEAEIGPIDLLIANAGIGMETSSLNYDINAMNKVLNVNLLGVSNSVGAVLPGMIERGRGHLVGISSIASYRGLPRMLAYCASKAGVNALFDGLRVELKPAGIHVTTVCPGWVKTPLTEKLEGRLEDIIEVETAAQEIAHAIRHKLAFYTFPRSMRWKLNFMMCWPRSWQDRLIGRKMGKIKTKKPSV